MSQFLDHVFIEVRSGDGGNGMVAWRREKYEPMGGPAGGNGGRGGHVVVESTNDLNTLIDFRFKSIFQAPNGQRGGPKSMHGKNAEDLIIRVPVGTVIKDAKTGAVVADLALEGQKVMVAEGGHGGRGNSVLASPTRRAPHFCEPGQTGVARRLEFELKILADVGLIGLPNAGKSTLLSVISRAKPKIADYPFSTLEPNLGVVSVAGGSFVVADIPGLIEGASQGAGLGHDFLRHTERTRLLVHLADVASETLAKDIETINSELSLYSEHLAGIPQILVLSKADTVDSETLKEAERKLAKTRFGKGTPPVVISAATGFEVKTLLQKIWHLLCELKKVEEPEAPLILPPDEAAADHGGSEFEVTRRKKVFTVSGDRIERIVAITNMRDPDSLHHLQHVLKVMGVLDALLSEGVKQGSEVHIAGVSFTFGDDWM